MDNLAEKVFCIHIQEYFIHNESLYNKLDKQIDGTSSIKFNNENLIENYKLINLANTRYYFDKKTSKVKRVEQ